MEKIVKSRKQSMKYILNMRPVLNRAALFSDGTEFYRTPAEPNPGDTVTIRFRTQRNNVDEVFLVHDNQKILMEVAKSERGYDYYAAEIQISEEIYRYYFEIHYGWVVCYYDFRGVSVHSNVEHQFAIYPGYHTPEWAKGAVMYQIYVDRFYNGDKTNDVETGEYFYIGDKSVKVEDWGKVPAVMGVREFYGGDLQGIIDKLDYLQELGIEVLYLNPIFVSPSNHKYDCQDYDYVDPHYGRIVEDGGALLAEGDKNNANAERYIRRVTDKRNLEASNQLFIELVEELHRRGMKIILDGVFNHCGSFNKWMDRERIYENQEGYEKGAYVSEDSPYHTFFKFSDQKRWPYNGSYEGWWTHDTLPKLNYEESEELYQYVLDIGKKWVSPPYNIDGWRLDVAADLGHSNSFNHKFWKDFRKVVKEANPNALILAEHYGSPDGWLQGDEWDSVMNYDAFMEPLTWFLTGMEKHSDEYRQDLLGNSNALMDSMKTHMETLHMGALGVAMNELSNHDHSRFLTRTNRRVGRISYAGAEAASAGVNTAVMREAVAFQMTWPGAPTVYYGDEAGVCGFTDPDNRRTYPWGKEDQELIEFHREMIKIHKKYPVLRNGSVKFLWNDYQGIAFARFTDDEQIIVVIHNDNFEKVVDIQLWGAGISRMEDVKLDGIMVSYHDGFSTKPYEYISYGGIVKVTIPRYGVLVLHHKEETKERKVYEEIPEEASEDSRKEDLTEKK